MSSLKDAAAAARPLELEAQLPSVSDAQNKRAMSVTPDVSHVEMGPYVASADALFESHAATAVLMLLS